MKADTITLGVEDFRRMPPELTITVRLSRPLRFRVWLATVLLRFAAWLVCGTANIETVE
jgi:hypothetical protein